MRNARLLVILLVAATVLVDLVTLSAVAGSHEFPPEWPHPVVILLFSLAISQVSLAAIWMVWGRTRLPWRTLSLVLTIVVWSRLLAWSGQPERHETLSAALLAVWLPSRHFLSGPEWFDGSANMFGLIFFAQCMGILVPSAVDRMAGTRLIWQGDVRRREESVVVRPRWQFSLGYLLSWITAVAVTLGVLQHTFDHRLLWNSVARYWGDIVVVGIAHGALALVALWSALETRWPWLWGTALVLTTVGAVAIVHALGIAEAFLAYGAMCVLQVLWTLASLWVFRVAGYRVVRRARARPDRRSGSPDGR